jgi:hypothetical protein
MLSLKALETPNLCRHVYYRFKLRLWEHVKRLLFCLIFLHGYRSCNLQNNRSREDILPNQRTANTCLRRSLGKGFRRIQVSPLFLFNHLKRFRPRIVIQDLVLVSAHIISSLVAYTYRFQRVWNYRRSGDSILAICSELLPSL